MDNFQIELSVLSDSLAKKEDALAQILRITENQTSLFDGNDDSVEIREFFNQMNGEKQTLIDVVLECDEVFEGIFKKFGDTFEDTAENYKDQIRILQEQIKRVMDLDIKIRLQEDKNKELAKEFNIRKNNPPKPPIDQIMKEYDKNRKR